MKRIFYYTIPLKFNNAPLLDFLKAEGYSHQVITHLKRTMNGILLNGIWAHTWDILHTNDYLTIQLVENVSSENIVPADLPLNIVYEDEDLLVINKPACMPIHPSQGNYDNTLANALAWHYRSLGEPFTYRCINRLDKDTTGLLIVAKHMYSASLLYHMSAERKSAGLILQLPKEKFRKKEPLPLLLPGQKVLPLNAVLMKNGANCLHPFQTSFL